IRESFDQAPDGGLPGAWAQWSGLGGSMQLSFAQALSKPNAVACAGGGKAACRALITEAPPADTQSGAAVFARKLLPRQVLDRGKELETGNAMFYAASVARGVEVKLKRVSGGAATDIGSVRSAKWLSEKWVRLTLRAEGKRFSVQLVRLDTNEYLA